jgi:hypothetical protein
VASSPERWQSGSKWGYTYTGEWRLDANMHEIKDLSVENPAPPVC